MNESYLGITEVDIEAMRQKSRKAAPREKRIRTYSSILLHPLELSETTRDAAHYNVSRSDLHALLWRNWKQAGRPPLICLPCEYDLEPEDD